MFNKTLRLISWVVIFQIIGFYLGRLTRADITSWYVMLHKSVFTPPGIVFAIVWTFLYVLLALSGWWLWENRQHTNAKKALFYFGAQMLMNWSWTPLFFHYHAILFSFIWMIGIILLTFITICLTYERYKFSSILLMPYLGWLIFACYLNASIYQLNP
jgi:tryptophan-rich sensory protein